jgi:hypothetical protein
VIATPLALDGVATAAVALVNDLLETRAELVADK